ncbi:zf-TFIIB domain-containing protein [Sphingomonas sp. LY29]|uniref:TFIIB-type zinc ribbon-containing protein n=1 Tax=unclassified Sphingomonas TaxID=196159 RepID=UPI002ADEAE72|nr:MULTISPECIES: zf-TFIIB domain-containing protein [unclassified Sphingomonas]MEA1072483.1 zf-TFIIB domain-containing protein [Sphingomonas sp. LY160]WRP24853.1 zf-TFIIB domain-containing protein [Sphingomonas sp. LY29]
MAHGPMTCPVDGATLVMSERSGIEIDYCPTCRGVWLDRGELDKIIERNADSMAPTPPQPPVAPHQPAPPPPPQQQPWGQPPHQQGYGQNYGYGHKPHKRRKSFLEELFD